jgi:hypothetical protein
MLRGGSEMRERESERERERERENFLWENYPQ